MSIKVVPYVIKRFNKRGKIPTVSPHPNLSQTCESTESSGCEKVGVASRREISIKTKNRAVGEAEYVDLKGMGLSRPRGLR